MQPERDIRPESHHRMCVEERLTRQTLQFRPIGILPRALDPVVAAGLDALPVHRLPRLRLEGDLQTLQREVQLRLAKAGIGADWLAEWLGNDLSFLGLMFSQLTGAQRLCLRLKVTENDVCRNFHVDNVRYRLVTTYRGSGTEWVPPHALIALPPSSPIPSGQVRQLERGWIAIMRGCCGATAGHPGVLHRSPAIDGQDIARLSLAINEAPRPS
ncbi:MULTISPECIES: DUF1826 domain-containing protein [Microvirga]|uniref:DUF1826 domain-containing protein n=1 Tax=Microvirga TaxID=186650 RepID=UPI001B366064|nr:MULTISPECIES: DUF1826 domain-containing protein [unclassified Microvirga]MBQ0819196.1 DUF1826 domain-containing protein [Microvirga sp. HBU67558]